MTTDHDDTEPLHAASPIDHILSEMQLYGYRPFQDEPDPRPLPEANTIATAVADIFDALVVASDRSSTVHRRSRSFDDHRSTAL